MQLSAVDLNLLLVLDALLQERSVSRAARRVGISASAMSHALARLRELFDDPILIRSGRTMVPTARGEALTDQARRAILEAEKVFTTRGHFDPWDLERQFRVAVSDIALIVLGPAFEHLLRSEAPGVDITYDPLRELSQPLRDGTFDLVIGPISEKHPEVRSAVLFEDRCVCVVRGDSPVGERVKIEQLVELPHVDVRHSAARVGGVDEALARHGVRRRVARLVSTHLMALHLVARTDYMAIVPSALARTVERALRLRVLLPPLELEPVEVGLAWHLRTEDDPSLVWLRQAVERAVDLSV